MRQQSNAVPARPAGWLKRDEQQHNMLHVSWLKGESRWQAKVPYKNEYGLSVHLTKKRGGPKVDWRVSLADILVVRDRIVMELASGRDGAELLGTRVGFTVKRWVDVYLATDTDLSAHTRENYANLLAFVVRDLGHIQLTLLTETQVRRWVLDMVEAADDPEVRHGMSTVVMALKRFKTCLEVAVDRKSETGLEQNVARRVSITKVAKRTMTSKLANYVTDPSETQRLVEACGERNYLAALPLVATDAGMRRGEIVALQWGDLNLDSPKPTITFRRHATTFGSGARRRTVVVPGSKTSQGDYVTLPLSQPAAQALRQAKIHLVEHKLAAGKSWRAGETGRGGYVIPSDPTAPGSLVFPMADGDMYDGGSLNTWFVQTICKRAGITTKSLHSLRHDCATFLLTRGVPLTVVAKHMRHSNPQITANTYSHLIKSQETLAPDTLGGIWAEVLARSTAQAV